MMKMTSNRFRLPPIHTHAPVSSRSNLVPGTCSNTSTARLRTGISPPVLGTCPKCEQAAKGPRATSIHATLAYSRCRCHRVFQSKLQRYQMSQRPMSQLARNRPNIILASRHSTEEHKPPQSKTKLADRSITLPDLEAIGVQSKGAATDMPMNYRHQTQLLPSSSSKSLLHKSVPKLRIDW